MTKKRRDNYCRSVDFEIGSRIRATRIKLGLSQTALADRLGVSFQQIQKYEKGTNSVACARVPQLCEALNMSPAKLFYGIASEA